MDTYKPLLSHESRLFKNIVVLSRIYNQQARFIDKNVFLFIPDPQNSANRWSITFVNLYLQCQIWQNVLVKNHPEPQIFYLPLAEIN